LDRLELHPRSDLQLAQMVGRQACVEQRAKGGGRVVYSAQGKWGAIAAPAEAEVQEQLASSW
jgi:hypothetical protein